MKRNTIKDLGTINIDKLEVISGAIEIFIPVEAVSSELDEAIERCEANFKGSHPEIKNVSTTMSLVFSMGYANPEFAIELMVMDADNEQTFEEYDQFFIGNVELSDEQTKQIKKVMWDKLGETLFNL